MAELDMASLTTLTTLLVSLLAGVVGKYYKDGKDRLGDIQKVLSDVDRAVYDDKITEEEFRHIYEGMKQVARGQVRGANIMYAGRANGRKFEHQIISEADLKEKMDDDWEIVRELSNKNIVVRRLKQ